MLKLWIVGASGQIGSAINEVLDPLEMEVFNTDKEELDITDTDEVLNFGVINRPDVIINCAAVTDTDFCEKEPELAYRVNALGARNLSIVARKTGAKMVQISTDDVFDGIRHTPYTVVRRHKSEDRLRTFQESRGELCKGIYTQAFHPAQ